jgi:hypothetical protein
VLLWGGTNAPKSLGTAMAKPDARSEDRDFIGYRQEEMRRRLTSIQQLSRSRCSIRECHSAAPRSRTGCPS